MADLLAETELTPEQRHYLDIMRSNGHNLTDLINSILDLVRIESGGLQLENVEFDLADLIDRTVSTFAVQAHGKGLELVGRISPETPHHLMGDPLRLRQIIANFIANAIKFTEQGGIIVEVALVRRAAAAAEVRFTVADTGAGIAQEKLDIIFSSFADADSPAVRKFGSPGLGLSIVKRLTDLMHGKTTVASEAGMGSKFSVIVPFGLPAQPAAPPSFEMPNLFGYRALVVDDHRINRQMVREALTHCRAEVSEAGTADEALWSIRYAVAMNKPFQIVLLCDRMAGGGLELLKRLRQEQLPLRPTIPMLYSDDIPQQIAQLKHFEIDAYLVKPITRRELFRVIAGKLESNGGISPQHHFEKSPSAPILLNSKHPVRILVAEDCGDNRVLLQAYLRKEPCLLTFVQDGVQAVEKAITNEYDLIFMDLQMPNQDGLSATRSIRKWESDCGRKPIPIIALTASALEEDVTHSLEAGCNAHFSKPVRKKVILDTIRDIMARRPVPRVILH
jgi:CheY-like chemotaxis protein